MQIGQQGLLELWATLGATKGIDLEGQILEAQGVQKAQQHADEVGVGIGAVRTEAFAVDLVELPHAPFLRAFIAEHGPGGEEAAYRFPVGEAAFDIGAHDARRRLWPQGQRPALAVGKGIHFFLHHIGFFTNGALKKLGKFHNGRAQFHKAVPAENIPAGIFHTGEYVAVRRKHVRETLDACNAHVFLKCALCRALFRPPGRGPEISVNRRSLQA